MKFKGEPGLLVRDIRKKKVYRFDKNGFFETDAPKLIRRMGAKFEAVEDANNEAAIKHDEPFKCPKCGKVCKNASGLSAHVRTCKGV